MIYTYITDFNLIHKEWKWNHIKFFCTQIHYLGSFTFSAVIRTTSTYSTNSSEESCRPGGPPTNGNYFAGNLFKCNLCEIAFAENAFLLTHLKNRHRSTVSKALKPHFSCGACPAKFFKNSFLVKHSECHGFNPSMQKLRQWYTYITDFDLIQKKWNKNLFKVNLYSDLLHLEL